MNTDLTQGTPGRVLWRFTLPMLLSMAFQQLYNLADSVVAGRWAGEGALAAVGASYAVTMIFMAVATGCNVGCGVVVSQLFGARDYSRMKTAVSTSLLSALALAALLTGIGFAACGPLLRLMHTPEDIMQDASVYLNIYIGGLCFLFLYNLCTGVFTALGDSRTPLYFLIASSLANVGADILFVARFHWGVAGVAWATFLCQGAASLLSALALGKRLRKIQATERSHVFSWRLFARVGRIAVPSMLQQSFISVGNVCVQSLVNGFGSAVVAGYSAAIKLNTFAITCYATLGAGLSSFTAQNLGAGKPERVRQGFRAGLCMTVGVAALFAAGYLVLAPQCIRLFLANPSERALTEGVRFLRIVSPFFLAVCVKLMADGVLRGAGSMACFMIATFTDLVLRVALAFVLAPHFGTDGVWLAWPLGWVTAMALSLAFYHSGVWEKTVEARHTA